MNRLRTIPCGEADDLAPLYVLGALAEPEASEVRHHLETCARPHPDFAELGGVVPHLADLADPVDAPPALRERVLGAIAADAASRRSVAPDTAAASGADARRAGAGDGARLAWRRAGRRSTATDGWAPAPGPSEEGSAAASRGRASGWRTWAVPLAAAVVIAALGAWNVALRSEASAAQARLAIVRDAIAVSAEPGARVARLEGSGTAAGAAGFAAFRPDGSGYVVMSGLPPAPGGHGYEAWYVRGDQAVPAGMLRLDENGLAVLDGLTVDESTEAIALTVEVASGVDAPTSEPLVHGTIEPATGLTLLPVPA